MAYFDSFPNRTLCDVLEEMRKCYETRNFCSMLGLIEEAQSFGNRMEAGLGDKHDVKEWTKNRAELKKDIKKLKAEIEALENKKEEI